MKQFLQQKWTLPVMIVTGVVITLLIIELQPELKHQNKEKYPVVVNAINVREAKVAPTITGFGNVVADRKLEAKAEVSGRVTYVHPELKKGTFLSQGTLLIKIDDKDYQLALKQAEADRVAKQANLKELELTIENNELELKLAKQKLSVRKKELNRLTQLQKQGSISQSRLDQEKQNYLQQQQEVQKLENLKTTLPSDMEVVKAQIAIAEAKVKQSERNLERTQIHLPFNGRISQVRVEKDQYITAASPLFNAFSMEKMLVEAQFPVEQFRQIAAVLDGDKLSSFSQEQNSNMTEILSSMGLSAEVNIAGKSRVKWKAVVERISDDLDPKSRTIGVTVSVSDSYQMMVPGKRPPLLEGMYMEVQLQGAAQQRLVIPRFALHQRQVYLINKEQQLERRTLKNFHLQDELVIVNQGLLAGEKIITSDVFPAVDGMTLNPQNDQRTATLMVKWLEQYQ
ncbi:efflux RND transporter periplasmic adaptor subunit [Pleionea sediminis]|uniref:efflux RND transporter periplasmic adaptor subunit n=1 Tax=Pleionea sediminis TaxID=2569479 RepID=UPI0011857F88|nr:biotin/lipoyl-binding protein [Pleionea sediminis]